MSSATDEDIASSGKCYFYGGIGGTGTSGCSSWRESMGEIGVPVVGKVKLTKKNPGDDCTCVITNLPFLVTQAKVGEGD